MPTSDPGVSTAPVQPPPRKPLVRSHSSTSIASLPTPPQTRKRKRSSSKHSRATDSDESDGGAHAYDSDEEELLKRKRGHGEEHSLVISYKKRRILRVDAIAAELSGKAVDAEAEEDAFWGVPAPKDVFPKDAKSGEGSSSTKSKDKETDTKAKKRGRSPSLSPARSPSASPPPHLLKRNAIGLPSPPQSRRRKSPRVLPFPVSVKTGEPSTPPRKTRGNRGVRRKLFIERDSPNNPFIDHVKGSDAVESSSPEAGSSEPRTPQPYVEKPTITYVFRGVRTEFENPLYDPKYPETGVPPPDADDPSKLPPEHPDFEAEPYCPPKLLFAEVHTKSKRKRSRKVAPGVPEPEKDKVKARELLKESDVKTQDADKGKAKAPAVVAEPVEADEGSDTREGKKPSTRRRPVPKKTIRSEWDTTDDEANEKDEDNDSPRRDRIPLPKGMEPAPRKVRPPAPVITRRTGSRSVTEDENESTQESNEEQGLSRTSKSRSRSPTAPKDGTPALARTDEIEAAYPAGGATKETISVKA